MYREIIIGLLELADVATIMGVRVRIVRVADWHPHITFLLELTAAQPSQFCTLPLLVRIAESLKNGTTRKKPSN